MENLKTTDLKILLTDGINRFLNSDSPNEIIDKHINKMFDDIISNQFKSWSDFGKSINNAIEESLPANITKLLDLPKYNDLIARKLRETWESSGIERSMITQANEAMNEVIAEGSIPEYIYLSDLLEAFIDGNSEEAIQLGWETPDIRIEHSSSYNMEFCHIYFDREPKKYDNNFLLSNNIACSYSRDKMQQVTSDKGEKHFAYKVYSAKLRDTPIGKNITSVYTKYEKLIIALYYGASYLVIDCDEHEDSFYYPQHD